jgi:hypothetical protein
VTAPAVRLLLADPGAALRLARSLTAYYPPRHRYPSEANVLLTPSGYLCWQEWGLVDGPAQALEIGTLYWRPRLRRFDARGALLAGLADELIDAFAEAGLTLVFPPRR